MSDRVRILLSIVAVLAALRLVVMPWVNAQAATHDRLFTVTRQLDRAEAIAEAGDDLLARRDALASSVALLAVRAPVAESVGEYRLQVQRQLRAAAEAAGVKLAVFEWVLDGEEEAAGLVFGRVRVQLEGTLRGIAMAHVEMEAGLPNLIVRDVGIYVSDRGGLTTAARGNYELDVYYRPGERP